jgi:hypothetical protein
VRHGGATGQERARHQGRDAASRNPIHRGGTFTHSSGQLGTVG